MMDEEKRPVLLPAVLVAKIEKKIENSHYASVGSYVEDVLNEVLKAEDMEIHLKQQEQMDDIRERLKKLGYMD
jgi:Arc/MetJ-type ribon-helix-helix transcriptional regulator